MTTKITGIVRDLEGQPLANSMLRFERRSGVRAQDGATVVPRVVNAKTDSGGNISVELYPGEYRAQAERGQGALAFSIGVPEDVAQVDLQDLIDQVPAITPMWASETRQARDDAVEAAESTAGSAEAAEDSASSASASADAASDSAGTAQVAEGGAVDARDKAQEWAENPEDDEIEAGAFSAKHHTAKAAQSAALSNRVIYVDTIADLQALNTSPLPDGQQVSVREYHEGTGRGGRTMIWGSTSTATANGGTVIAPESGSGRWLWDGRGDVTPLLFGARGDGTTNDWGAIAAMFAAAPAGSAVTFADCPDQYLIDPDLTPGSIEGMSAFSIDKPLTIKGTPGGRVKLADLSAYTTTDERGTLFWISSSDVTVDGVHLDMNSRETYVEVDGVKYYSGNDDPDVSIGVTGFLARRVGTSQHLKNVAFRNNYIYDTGHAAISVSGNRLSDSEEFSSIFGESNTVSQCAIENNWVEGGQRSTLVFIGGVRDSVMRGNTLVNPNWAGIRFYLMCYNCTAENNHISYNGSQIDPAKVINSNNSVQIGGTPYPHFMRFGHNGRAVGTVRKCRFLNNTISVINTADLDAGIDDTGPRYGVYISEDADYNTVQGTIIRGPMRTGIYTRGNKGLKVVRNQFKEISDGSATQIGVDITGDLVDAEFDGNSFRECVSAIASFGSTIHNLTRCSISNTEIRDCANGIFLLGRFDDSTISGKTIIRDTTNPIRISAMEKGEISDPYINGCAVGIRIEDAVDVLVSNPNLYDYDRGIDIREASINTTVMGGLLRTARASSNGVRILHTAAEGIALLNNDLRGSGTTPITDNGTGTITEGNLT